MCSRLNRAKVFVDVDISQPLHAKVRIELPKGRSYWQPIIYENISAYCPRCRHRGHAEPVSSSEGANKVEGVIEKDSASIAIA